MKLAANNHHMIMFFKATGQRSWPQESQMHFSGWGITIDFRPSVR